MIFFFVRKHGIVVQCGTVLIDRQTFRSFSHDGGNTNTFLFQHIYVHTDPQYSSIIPEKNWENRNNGISWNKIYFKIGGLPFRFVKNDNSSK